MHMTDNLSITQDHTPAVCGSGDSTDIKPHRYYVDYYGDTVLVHFKNIVDKDINKY